MSRVAARFALRHRTKVLSTLRYSGRLLSVGLLSLVGTVGPTLLLWWDTAVPAAIGTAVFAFLLLGVVVTAPLDLIAYVGLYFDRSMPERAPSTLGFGRRLYRASGRLEALARAAGLPPLSDFESADTLETGAPPVWHEPRAALPTVEHLLATIQTPSSLQRDLRHLQAALRLAADRGARFYLLLQTFGGITNAEVEARRGGIGRDP